MEPMESAYRSRYSTETALVKVKADLLNAIDNKEVVCQVFLDLSAAFDTVEHQILLERLEKRFGFYRTSNQLDQIISNSQIPEGCGR